MVKILKEEGNKMVVELEDITLANLLGEYLWSIKGVNFAGMVKEHPYLEKPKVIVSASDPKKALETAAKEIADDADSLKKHLKK
jgi:DNA-directed RNA polymerase subunit L